jgi:hypothetical protein
VLSFSNDNCKAMIPEPNMKSMMPLYQSSVDLSHNQTETVLIRLIADFSYVQLTRSREEDIQIEIRHASA